MDNRKTKKVISFLLVLTFLTTNFLYAAPVSYLRVPLAANGDLRKDLEGYKENGGDPILKEYEVLQKDYLNKKISFPTYPIDRMFRISDAANSPHIDLTKLNNEERQALYKEVIAFFKGLKERNGKIAIGLLIAGSASRMQKDQGLPSILTQVQSEAPDRFGRNEEETPEAKALLPAAKINGRWMTFLDLYLINLEKVNNDFEKLGLGRPFVAVPLSNDVYQDGFIKEIKRANEDGIHNITPEEIKFYYQRLGYMLAATVEDVKANKSQFTVIVDDKGAEAFDEESYNKALEFAKEHGGDILTDIKKTPEGHGETAHAFFETQREMKEPIFVDFFNGGVEYYYTHNVDNMAFVDDNWMLIFANMIINDLEVVMEVSKKVKGAAGKGGGFTVSEGKARQMEDDVIKASTARYNFDRDADEVSNNPEGKDSTPTNNGTLYLKFPDGFSNSYGDERLKHKDKVSGLTKDDFSNIAAKGRRNFGLAPTYKVVKLTDGSSILVVKFETRYWEIQNGNKTGVARTLSTVDIDEKVSSESEKVRFCPLKTKPDYDNLSLQNVREDIAEYIVNGEMFSEEFKKIATNSGSQKIKSLGAAKGFTEERRKMSRRQQVDSLDQIIAVPADSVIGDKAGFEKWLNAQPANVAVVIIAFDPEEYNGVREYSDVAYIKVFGTDLEWDVEDKLDELFAVYGNNEFFRGFKLGTPYSIDEYKSVIDAVSEGV